MRMSLTSPIRLAVSARLAANANGTGVDVSAFTGKCMLLLNASATEGAGMTLDVKIQHSDDNATFVDAGVAFRQVTNAADSFQVIEMDIDGFKKYIRAVDTLGGASPAVTRGVALVAKRA